MIVLAGTIPDKDLPLITGPAGFSGRKLIVAERAVERTQGTGAMVSAALQTALYLKQDPPIAVLAGDMGKGEGSRAVYEYLIDNLATLAPEVLALHYCLPDILLTKRLLAAVSQCAKKPVLVADAGSMYAAKAAGLSPAYDVFTPDAAETAFLADPSATHPAYVKFMTYNAVDKMPQLIQTAFRHHDTARYMLVKGVVDYIVKDGDVRQTVNQPDVPAMEPIGGTGDTITGMAAALLGAGLQPEEALVIAAKANRMAGKMAGVTPASRITQIIDILPEVFRQHLCEWSGICTGKDGKQCWK